MHALDNYFAQGFLAKKLVDRPRKQILNRSVNCLIVSRKENKVAMCKLGTIVFALFSVFSRPFRFSVENQFSLTGRQESGQNKCMRNQQGAPNVNFRTVSVRKTSRIFGTFVAKFLACLPLLGFSNI